MLSPSAYSPSRQPQPPPVRPSRSLEGLEKVIPPSSPLPVAHTRSRLHLDKPLPDLPARSRTQSPAHFVGSTAWSDDSSTVNSFEDDDDDDDDEDDLRCRRRSSISTESYPVFVRSGSDDPDLAGFVDHPSVSTLDRIDTPAADPFDNHQKTAAASSLPGLTFLADERYTPSAPPQQHWNNHVGPNHYFREKKWDFFPELATPSALPQNSPHNGFTPRPRKKDTARRWIPIPSDKGAAFANDVRNSIRSIQRRLSRNSMDKDKPKRGQSDGRPTTSPIEFARGLYSSSTSSPQPQLQTPSSTGDYYFNHRVSSIPQTPVYTSVDEKLTHLSISPTGSSISDQSMLAPETLSQSLSNTCSHSEKPLPSPVKPKEKQLAVPISAYQKYGAAIWDKSGKEKAPKPKHQKRLSYQHHRQQQRVRFPKYRNRKRRESTKFKGNNNILISSTTPLKPSGRKQTSAPLRQGTRYAVRALQGGTSQVLVAIDGARRRMAETSPLVSKRSRLNSASTSKLDMRKTHLKSQIRLVGPVNPYTTTHRRDQWI